jgi:hypothetical protein
MKLWPETTEVFLESGSNASLEDEQEEDKEGKEAES